MATESDKSRLEGAAALHDILDQLFVWMGRDGYLQIAPNDSGGYMARACKGENPILYYEKYDGNEILDALEGLVQKIQRGEFLVQASL